MLWLLLTAALAQHPAPPEIDHEAELTAYVEAFLHPVRLMRSYKNRREQALSMIPLIIKYCDRYGVDPLLAAVVISHESSWRPNVTGRLGEIGLLQTMPHHFKRFDLTTVDGQLHAGISHLGASLVACDGQTDQALNYYGTARCKPVGRWVTWRLRSYKRALRRFRR
jgi:hypothetical protein